MRTKRAMTLAGLTAAVLSAGLWVLIPAWGGQAPSGAENGREWPE